MGCSEYKYVHTEYGYSASRVFIDWGDINDRYKQMKQYRAQIDCILDGNNRDSKLRVAPCS